MSVGGWVVMLVTWTGIICLVVFCFGRTLGRRKSSRPAPGASVDRSVKKL